MGAEFGFKELLVWRKSMDFATRVISVSESLQSNAKHYRLLAQIEAAAVSVPANIAEGKGRESKKEYVRFLYIARGSLYETITILNIFESQNWISSEILQELEEQGIEIASMLKGLINAIMR